MQGAGLCRVPAPRCPMGRAVLRNASSLGPSQMLHTISLQNSHPVLLLFFLGVNVGQPEVCVAKQRQERDEEAKRHSFFKDGLTAVLTLPLHSDLRAHPSPGRSGPLAVGQSL